MNCPARTCISVTTGLSGGGRRLGAEAESAQQHEFFLAQLTVWDASLKLWDNPNGAILF